MTRAIKNFVNGEHSMRRRQTTDVVNPAHR